MARREEILLMDGAMGTELQRAGILPGECHELWNLTHPEVVRAVHRAYVEAGARCLLTNTFQSNPAALSRHAREHELETINRTAVELARSAGGAGCPVLADVGPMSGEEEFARVVRSLAGADALLLETWSDPAAVVAAGRACRLAEVPVFLSFAFRAGSAAGEGPRIQGGLEPEQVAELAGRSGIAALGANCGRDIGMEEITEIIRRYRRATDLPLFARPNAGSPRREGSRWVYPHTPEQMAARLPALLEGGATMVGGCCGTTPGHIAAFRAILARHPKSPIPNMN